MNISTIEHSTMMYIGSSSSSITSHTAVIFMVLAMETQFPVDDVACAKVSAIMTGAVSGRNSLLVDAMYHAPWQCAVVIDCKASIEK